MALLLIHSGWLDDTDVMAIDFNSVKFLFWAKNLGVAFHRTATLGHLGMACSAGRVQRAARDFGIHATAEQIRRCFQRQVCKDLYSDGFLRLLGAEEIVSVDRSDYEGASFLHDLNEPFPETMRGRFDLVLDGGTLEHVFHYPAALKHSLELLRVGGHFITITPANGLMGHGFYQFSPELFFSVFNYESGFRLRKIVLHEALKADAPFYEVNNPATIGGRGELNSPRPIYLSVLAQKTADVPILSRPPQQSDYVAIWKEPKRTLDPSLSVGKLRMALNPYWPTWLRSWKMKLFHRLKHGPATLNNPRAFRRLGRKAVAEERMKGDFTPGA
jgi:SAM-dependent methyltransferase